MKYLATATPFLPLFFSSIAGVSARDGGHLGARADAALPGLLGGGISLLGDSSPISLPSDTVPEADPNNILNIGAGLAAGVGLNGDGSGDGSGDGGLGGILDSLPAGVGDLGGSLASDLPVGGDDSSGAVDDASNLIDAGLDLGAGLGLGAGGSVVTSYATRTATITIRATVTRVVPTTVARTLTKTYTLTRPYTLTKSYTSSKYFTVTRISTRVVPGPTVTRPFTYTRTVPAYRTITSTVRVSLPCTKAYTIVRTSATTRTSTKSVTVTVTPRYTSTRAAIVAGASGSAKATLKRRAEDMSGFVWPTPDPKADAARASAAAAAAASTAAGVKAKQAVPVSASQPLKAPGAAQGVLKRPAPSPLKQASVLPAKKSAPAGSFTRPGSPLQGKPVARPITTSSRVGKQVRPAPNVANSFTKIVKPTVKPVNNPLLTVGAGSGAAVGPDEAIAMDMNMPM